MCAETLTTCGTCCGVGSALVARTLPGLQWLALGPIAVC
jgi:hypothetical protein